MCVMGLDIGTTGCKAAVFDAGGLIVASSYQEYPLLYPRKGWMGLDPERVLESVYACIAHCARSAETARVRALAISSQGRGCCDPVTAVPAMQHVRDWHVRPA